MAPRKTDADKHEKISGNEAVALVLEYLEKTNRPYSVPLISIIRSITFEPNPLEQATDISSNLHNRITKTVAAKILKDLHERKQISGRASGKQIVYHAVQDPSSAPSQSDLDTMTAQTHSFRHETANLQASLKTLKSQLNAFVGTQSSAELRASITYLESQRDELLARLGPLREGTLQLVSGGEGDRVRADLSFWAKRSQARGLIVRDLWGMIGEVVQGEEREILKEQFGLE